MLRSNRVGAFLFVGLSVLLLATPPATASTQTAEMATDPVVRYGTETIGGVGVFYREAGSPGSPGNQEIQLALFYDYRTNVPLYPRWQKYFRTHLPPTLIVWGENDPIFPAEGAHPYLRDLPNAELHLLNTGHFALEEDGPLIVDLIREFMLGKVAVEQEQESD